MAIKGNWPNSQKNSTDIPLAAGATFVGGAEAISQTEQPQSVSVSVTASTDSSKDGLQLQFSPDGTNWDLKYKYTVRQGETFVITRNIELRYFRVCFQATATQTSFRLQTRFNMRAADTPAVRISNGEGFVNEDLRDRTFARIMQAIEQLEEQQKITNLHLSKITNEHFTEIDIEIKG